MRLPTRFVAALLSVFLAQPLFAQTKSTSEFNTAPKEIGGKTLSQWIQELRHADPSVRDEAIRAIIQFGPAAQEAVPLLVDQTRNMQDGNPRVRAVIALSMVEVNEKDIPKVVEALGKRLKEDPQSIIRYHAAMGLVRFSSEAGRVLDDIIKGTTDMTAYDIRRASVIALRGAGLESTKVPIPRATHALLNRLRDANGYRDPSSKVRMEAIIGLGAMGRPTDPHLLATVLKALENSLQDNDKLVRLWAHVSIMALDNKVTDTHLQAVIKCLKNKDLELRCAAAEALGIMGSKSKAAVPDLVDALHDKEPSLIVAAAVALAQIGDPNDRALKRLAELSARPDIDENTRAMFKSAMEQLKNPPKDDKPRK
jgi:HEAT repeat protein